MYVQIYSQISRWSWGIRLRKQPTFRDATRQFPRKMYFCVVPGGGVAKANPGFLLREGGVRVCGAGVLLDFWCGFAEIYILSCGIAVLQYQAVYGI